MSLSNSSCPHLYSTLCCFVPPRHLLWSSDCSASVCEMDDNSWEQRCCDADPASRHLGGQRGPSQARCWGGPTRVEAEKERFCHACSFHPKPHKPYLAILQVLKDVHELRQGFDARVSAVEGILPKYVPQLYHHEMFKNVIMNAWLKTIKLFCLE